MPHARSVDRVACGVVVAAVQHHGGLGDQRVEQSGIGADQAGLATRQLQITSSRLAVVTRVAKDEDADLASAISALSRAETACSTAPPAAPPATAFSSLDTA